MVFKFNGVYIEKIFIRLEVIKSMIVEVVILLLGIPAGFLLAYWANDELVQGRRWFLGVVLAGAFVGVYFAFVGNFPLVWTAGFVVVVATISFWKSFDRKWIRKVFK